MPKKGYRQAKEHKNNMVIATLKGRLKSDKWRKSLNNPKRIEKIRNYRIGKKLSDESKEKLCKKREGSNNPMFGRCGKLHPNWQNGKSFEEYGFGWTDDLKESIRKRDGYVCQLCGIHQNELDRKLHCHHIDYDKRNLNPNNLISLCVSCHIKTNYNRNYWTNFFNQQDY